MGSCVKGVVGVAGGVEQCWLMLCRFAYLLVRRFLDVVSGCFRSRLGKEVEIAVLRHQVEVLRRQVTRLDLEPADRAVLDNRTKKSDGAQDINISPVIVEPATIVLRAGFTSP